MNTALDVAKYVVNISNEIGFPLNRARLQATLYYIQSHYVRRMGRLCFQDEILFGVPVTIPSVDKYFRRYGRMEIPAICYYYLPEQEQPIVSEPFRWDSYQFDSSVLPKEDREQITELVKRYAAFPEAELLVRCAKDKPVQSVMHGGKDTVITIESSKKLGGD